jgi:hypothetical protein
VEILKDKYGGSQGLIREIAGGQERLVDIGGQAIATCRPSTNFTCDNNGTHIDTRNSLPGLAGRKN